MQRTFSAKRSLSTENVVFKSSRNIKTATRRDYVPENILSLATQTRQHIAQRQTRRPKTSPKTNEYVSEYILVPGSTAKVRPKIWSNEEFQRIKSMSKVVTNEEKIRQLEEKERHRQLMTEDCEKRKQLLRQIDELNEQNRKKPTKNLPSFETAEQKKILDRAFMAKQEEQEEIKRANRIILAAKCHLIRDAQIAERNELEKELRQEDLRLEREMAEDRERAIRMADVQQQRDREINKRHAKEIEDQLKRRELVRLMEAERIEEERKQLQKAQASLKDTDEKDRQRREENSRRLKSDFQKAYEMSQWFKKVEFEQDRVAEMRIQEHMKIRKKREEQLELEKRLAREQKERDHDRLLKQQQKVIDTKNEKFEIMVRREQERKEREYRQKEKDAVIKKIELQRTILDARRVQQDELKRIKEQLEQKEVAEYEKNLERYKKEVAQEKQVEARRIIEREKYCHQILDQIKYRETVRNDQRSKAKIELDELKKAEKTREETLNQVLRYKLQELKDSKIPDKLIKDVERQLNVK